MGDVFSWRDLVGRARVYLDDDHDEKQGWIRDDKWLPIAIAEYKVCYRRWLRAGIVRPLPIDTSLPSAQFQVVLPTQPDVAAGNVGCLAIIGVAENMTSYMRILSPAQPARGAFPFWVAPGQVNEGKATSWAAFGSADEVTVEISPRDQGSPYVVRWIPTPVLPASLDDQVTLPWDCDERLVLGMARRAHLKDSSASQLLDKLIDAADAEIQFSAWGRLDTQAPRVRRVRPDFHRRRWPQLSTDQFPTDPNYWMYP
jgi:hypothetical protein